MPAALARIRVEIRLIPATSTTEYIIVTSVEPTYGLVSPDATVETISFGTPTGSARIACVASVVPPVPPSAPIASSRPSASSRRTISAAPRPIASIAAPRSPASARRLHVGACRCGDLLPGHVGLGERLAEDARVDQQHLDPARP